MLDGSAPQIHYSEKQLMSDIQISRPVLIALIGAIVLGGFVLLRGGSGEELPPPAPIVTSAATGATGASDEAGPTGPTATGEATTVTGATKEAKETAAEKRRRIRIERRKKLVEAAKAAGMPTPVYGALKKGKTVMIFFWEPNAKDDERVDDSIKNLQAYRGSSLVVFREEIANKSKYDGIAQAAELTQTPGIVILYKDEADTAQGYIDSAALNAKITRLTGDSGSD